MSDIPETGTWRFVFPPNPQAVAMGIVPLNRDLVVRDSYEDVSGADKHHVVMRDAQGRVTARVPLGSYEYMERVTDDSDCAVPAKPFQPTSVVMENLNTGTSAAP